MNSDTPRTDDIATDIIGFYSCATVPADFARELERQLAAVEAERDELRRKRDELWKFSTFAKSCILSGESWSPTAQALYDAAIDAAKGGE